MRVKVADDVVAGKKLWDSWPQAKRAEWIRRNQPGKSNWHCGFCHATASGFDSPAEAQQGFHKHRCQPGPILSCQEAKCVVAM